MADITAEQIRKIIVREQNKRDRQMDALAITRAAIIVFESQLENIQNPVGSGTTPEKPKAASGKS